MKPMKKEETTTAQPAETTAETNAPADVNSARGLLARVRERLISAELEDVTRPNQLLVRGLVGTATVAVGYANPDIRELTVMREFRFTRMVPGTDPEKPGAFRAWEDFRECPRPSSKELGHTVWLLAVHPKSIQVPIGVDLKLPEIAENANLGTREHPLHGTTRYIVQLPRDSWTKKLKDDKTIRRVFKLNSWVPLERQPGTNWLVALVEFIGDTPNDFDPEHDRLQITVTARPATLGWMSREDAEAACEAARFNRSRVVTSKIKVQAAAPQSDPSKSLEDQL